MEQKTTQPDSSTLWRRLTFALFGKSENVSSYDVNVALNFTEKNDKQLMHSIKRGAFVSENNLQRMALALESLGFDVFWTRWIFIGKGLPTPPTKRPEMKEKSPLDVAARPAMKRPP